MTTLHDLRVLHAARETLEADLPDRADVRRVVATASPTGGTVRTPRIVERDVPVSVKAGGGNITVTADQAEEVLFLEARVPLSAPVARGDELLIAGSTDVLRVVSVVRPRSLGLLQRLICRQVRG